MGPGGSREAPEVQKSLPGGSREALEAQKSLPGGSREAPEAQKSLLGAGGSKNRSPRPPEAQKGPKMVQNAAFSMVWGLPGEGPGGAGPGSGVQTPGFLGPGGRLQRGVLSLRTSEFWRPDLGDLEAKNSDSLEDYTLVAKTSPLNSLVAPQGGRRIIFGPPRQY